MSVYGTIVEVKMDGGAESRERAMLICETEDSDQSFEAVVVLSPGSWTGAPYQRVVIVRGLRGATNSMWSVRKEKP